MGSKSKIVVFDFETGGLDPNKHPAMELGLVTLDQHSLEEEIQYEALIQPYSDFNGVQLSYDPKALEVHGIDPSRTQREGKTVEEVVSSLIKLFGQIKGARDPRGLNKPILCGHNVYFDVSFLEYMFTLCGQDLSKHVLSSNGKVIAWDTQQIAGMLWNTSDDGAKYNLGACCERAGLGNFLAHSALSDTKTTADLLRFFLRSFRSGKQDVAASTEQAIPAKRRDKIVAKPKVKFQF